MLQRVAGSSFGLPSASGGAQRATPTAHTHARESPRFRFRHPPRARAELQFSLCKSTFILFFFLPACGGGLRWLHSKKYSTVRLQVPPWPGCRTLPLSRAGLGRHCVPLFCCPSLPPLSPRRVTCAPFQNFYFFNPPLVSRAFGCAHRTACPRYMIPLCAHKTLHVVCSVEEELEVATGPYR